MTAKQIKEAVNFGLQVNWSNPFYVVIKDNIGQYMIKAGGNGSLIGLTYRDGKTLNGDENEFTINAQGVDFPLAVCHTDGSATVCHTIEEVNTILLCILDSEFLGFTNDVGIVCDNVTAEQVTEVFEEVTRQGLLPLLSADDYKEVLYCIVGVNDAAAGEYMEISDDQKRLYIQFLTILNRQ